MAGMVEPDTLILDRSPGETRLAALADGRLTDFLVERDGAPPRRAGEIALARVAAVRRELNAAFLDIGGAEAFLPLARREPPAEGSFLAVAIRTEPSGRKMAEASRHIELGGTSLTLQPASPDLSIAGAIKGKAERARLKELLRPLLPAGLGLLVGPAADGATPDRLAAELAALLDRWRAIERAAASGGPARAILPAPSLAERAARDFPSARLVESRDGTGFTEAGIEEQVEETLARRIRLASGPVLTVDETEALVAIDVDIAAAGIAPRGWPVLFAGLAGELARLIRLRRLAGLVAVDFPRLDRRADREAVEGAVAAAVAGDPDEARVLGWSRGGLLELTRTRRGSSLAEDMLAPADPRPLAATVALSALRRTLAGTQGVARPVVACAPAVAAWLEGPGAAALAEVRRRLGGDLTIRADHAFPRERVEILDGRTLG